MPRTGRCRSLSLAAALIAMLAAPAAAHAATYTVKVGDGACGGADLACGGLAEAADAAAVGDIFKVAQGTAPYGSATFDVGGVTIVGDPIFVVNGTLTFTGGSGGPAKLQKVGLSQGNGTAPGVVSTGAAGLEISDAFIHSQNDDGVRFTESAANKIVRSTVATSGTGTSAVKVTSSDTSSSTKGLLMESTLVTGGVAGLAVVTGESAPVTIGGRRERHAAPRHGGGLDERPARSTRRRPRRCSVGRSATSPPPSPTRSSRTATSKTIYPGLLSALLVILAPPNTITDTYTRTLQGAFDAQSRLREPRRQEVPAASRARPRSARAASRPASRRRTSRATRAMPRRPTSASTSTSTRRRRP